MKINVIVLAMIGLFLAGCEDPEDIQRQHEYIQQNIPQGCIFRDLGPYRNIRRVLVITCSNKTTSSSNVTWRESHGKTHSDYYATTIEITD